jgi:hypothetical protein
MKATLEFKLPDEDYFFECANKGFDVVKELTELQQTLHSQVKHGHHYKTIDEALEDTYQQISNILSCITVYGY